MTLPPLAVMGRKRASKAPKARVPDRRGAGDTATDKGSGQVILPANPGSHQTHGVRLQRAPLLGVLTSTIPQRVLPWVPGSATEPTARATLGDKKGSPQCGRCCLPLVTWETPPQGAGWGVGQSTAHQSAGQARDASITQSVDNLGPTRQRTWSCQHQVLMTSRDTAGFRVGPSATGFPGFTMFPWTRRTDRPSESGSTQLCPRSRCGHHSPPSTNLPGRLR